MTPIPNDEATRTAVREAMAETVGHKVRDDEPVLSSGLIDSLSVLKLIARLEKKLNCKLHTEALQPDDFDTIEITLETLQRAQSQG